MPDPNHKDASKRLRQSIKRRAHNRHYRSMMRNQIKALNDLVEAGDADGAKTQLASTVSIIQTVSQKGIIHKSQAARRVSRLSKAVNSIGS